VVNAPFARQPVSRAPPRSGLESFTGSAGDLRHSVVARTAHAQEVLARAFHDRLRQEIYLAISWRVLQKAGSLEEISLPSTA
jgi:hypothetical protein